MGNCWERVDLLAFRLCCFILCSLNCSVFLSRLVFGAGCGIPLYRFFISAFTFSFQVKKDTNVKWKRNTPLYSHTNCVAISFFTQTTILWQINLAIVFYASDPSYHAFIVILLHQDTSADHQRRISWKNKSRMINRNVCTSVTSVFKASWRKTYFWWQAEANAILKRVFSHQNKGKKQTKQNSCWKHLNRLREIRLQIVKIRRFSCFYNIVLKQRF